MSSCPSEGIRNDAKVPRNLLKGMMEGTEVHQELSMGVWHPPLTNRVVQPSLSTFSETALVIAGHLISVCSDHFGQLADRG